MRYNKSLPSPDGDCRFQQNLPKKRRGNRPKTVLFAGFHCHYNKKFRPVQGKVPARPENAVGKPGRCLAPVRPLVYRAASIRSASRRLTFSYPFQW